MKDADGMQGAPDPDARLRGEILSSLSTWTAEYEQEGLDLAWTVAQMLLQHVNRTNGLADYIAFIERVSAILGDEAAALRQVIAEDFRKRMN